MTTCLSVQKDKFNQAIKQSCKVQENNAKTVKKLFTQRHRFSLTNAVNRRKDGISSQLTENDITSSEPGKNRKNKMHEEENFALFAKTCNFPMNMPMIMQQYIYFLKCMNNKELQIDTTNNLHELISCPIMRKNVDSIDVVEIEIAIVILILGIIHSTGQPLTILKKFKADCINNYFGQNEIKKIMNWSMVLKLYIASYQRSNIMLQCWQAILKNCAGLQWEMGMCNEVIQSVRNFVTENRFESDDIMFLVDKSIRAKFTKI